MKTEHSHSLTYQSGFSFSIIGRRLEFPLPGKLGVNTEPRPKRAEKAKRGAKSKQTPNY